MLLKLYRHLPRIRPDTVRTWIYRVTVNVCHDIWRKGWRFPTSSLAGNEARPEFTFAGTGQIEAGIERKERLHILHAALQELPFKERAALVLRDVEGLSTEETAAVLGSSAATIRSQISSARVKLRRYCALATGRQQ